MTRCASHKMALSFNQELVEFPMEVFTSVGLFITKLHFVACSLSSLPEAFCKELNKLRDLNLSRNNLTDVPSGIEQLTDLESLDVSSNKLTTLPDNLKKLQDSLEILIISDNYFEKFPTVVWSCTQLQKLEADNVGVVTEAKNLKDLKNLRILSLSGNVFKPLPKEIEDLPLEQLDLSGVPWITDKSIQHFNIDRFNTAINKIATMRSMDQKVRKSAGMS